MRDLWSDAKQFLRYLRRHPGFASISILTLALGIGFATAVFAVIYGVLLSPLPYPDSDELVTIWQRNLPEDDYPFLPTSYPNFVDWREQNTVFEDLAAIDRESFNLTGDELPERVLGARVTASLFPMLRAQAAYGRVFTKDQNLEAVVVLGDSLWQRRFGASREVLGSTLNIDGEPFTIIGVMPPGFEDPITAAELWVPVERYIDERYRQRSLIWLRTLGRLKPGVELSRAQEDMATVAARLAEQYPDANGHMGTNLVPLKELLVGDTRPALLILFGAVGIVLVIACFNVASLMLSRASERHREFAINLALGAKWAQIVRKLTVEGVVIGLLSGILGLFLAVWLKDFLLGLQPDAVPRADEIRINWVVGSFTLGVSLLTALFTGLLPMPRALAGQLQEPLKQGGSRAGSGGARTSWLRNGIIVFQVGMAVLLLVGAGLVVKSFQNVRDIDIGFDPSHLLVAELSIPEVEYPERQDRANLYQRLKQEIETIPAVRTAAVVNNPPLEGIDTNGEYWIEGRAPRPEGQSVSAIFRVVGEEYFELMEIPLLRGRGFNRFDRIASEPVAIVDRAMVEQEFPEGDPIGARLSIDGPEGPWYTIVGVVGSVRHWLRGEPSATLYLPFLQRPQVNYAVIARTETDAPPSLGEELRAAVTRADPNLPAYELRTMRDVFSRQIAEDQLNMTILLLFAGIAVLLVVLGLYGIVSYYVSRQTQEIGVRMALGADEPDILRMVLKKGTLLALVGVVLGLIGSLAANRLMKSVLYEVDPTDPFILAVVVVLLVGVATAASYLPARRAMKTPPVSALRYE